MNKANNTGEWVKRYADLRENLNMTDAINKLIEEVKAQSTANQDELWGQLSETWKDLTDHEMKKRSHSFDILKSKFSLTPK